MIENKAEIVKRADRPENSCVRPFLKWAGGKTQLLDEIEKRLPRETKKLSYVEPFIGSGAVLFKVLKEAPFIDRAVINDVNLDLICAYRAIQENPSLIIAKLQGLKKRFYSRQSEEERSELFYEIRDLFNSRKSSDVEQAAYLIFLNKTCFNGLYRVNKKNEFNVPFGYYKKPNICDEQNIMAAHSALQKVTVIHGDYSETLKYVQGPTFFYFDPPYKPISKTSYFSSYSKDAFGDEEQIRLKDFCDELNSRGIKWLLSNSDPKNNEPDNNFFDRLYARYNVVRVSAKRNINSNGSKRGEISELLISNY